MDQFQNTAAEKTAAMQTEEFFSQRRNRADREAFRRILNRQGGEPPSPEDTLDDSASQ
jgi:hypothetical protein